MNQNNSPVKPMFIWDGVYNTFEAAAAGATGAGFSGESWLFRSRNAINECLSSLESSMPIPPFHKQRSTLLPVTVAMMLDRTSTLRVLDFGGGFGIGYLALAESIPDDLHRIAYTIVEVPKVCAEGRKLIGKRGVSYLDSLPESGSFDLLYSASALQYIEEWQGLLKKFAAYKPEYLLLSDVFAGEITPFVTLQNYYESRIPHWFLNIEELLGVCRDLGYRLILKSYATSRRLDVEDTLPMENFPKGSRLRQSLHLLMRRVSRP